jgi:mannosyl-oligosaccharide alpha-1,2-mannosidase
MISRRSFLETLAATATAPLLASAPSPEPMPSAHAIAGQVRDEFLHAWNGYKRFAWGHDEVLPITGKPSDFFVTGHSFGLSIIESLDTLYVMGLDDELRMCVKWLRSNLSFDVDGEVEMFEAMIRMVAGCTTGYYATGESFLLKGARDLADRLLACFTKSPSGAPYRFVNLRTGAVRDPVSNLAEIGSNILEFGDITRLTGDSKYLDASMKAFEAVIAKRSALNLLGTNFDVEKGDFSGTDDVAPNPPADSFYEYLWGGWQMLGLAQSRDWYRLLTDAILKYQLTRVNGNTWFRAVDYRTGVATADTTQSELAAFYAELLAKGGNRVVGEAYYDSWTSILAKYELIPETINYTDSSVVDPGYGLRPEYPNSAFDLWFLTHDDKYRQTAYSYFKALRKNCRTADGYAALTDIRTTPMTFEDNFPAYAFSENFKYLYLMFADSPRFDGANYYLNTEGKVMRGLRVGNRT